GVNDQNSLSNNNISYDQSSPSLIDLNPFFSNLINHYIIDKELENKILAAKKQISDAQKQISFAQEKRNANSLIIQRYMDQIRR
ncbi:7123_t:CDS:1, partial [Scutellospora calospora]